MGAGHTERSGGTIGGSYATAEHTECSESWWRRNRSIRWYGLLALGGTKLADIVTTAVGVQYVSTVVEANPLANWVFIETGLFSGLALLGTAVVILAACVAELSSIKIYNRFGLPTTALVAQASVYVTLSLIFGIVALYNTALIADQAIYMINDVLALPSGVN